jgi:hypothetical protein
MPARGPQPGALALAVPSAQGMGGRAAPGALAWAIARPEATRRLASKPARDRFDLMSISFTSGAMAGEARRIDRRHTPR